MTLSPTSQTKASSSLPLAVFGLSASARVPWGVFLFLWAVFFLAEPLNPAFSNHALMNLEESDLKIEDRVERNIELNQEGSRGRQIGLVALACFGIFNLLKPAAARVRVRNLLGGTFLFFLVWSGASVVWSDEPLVTVRKGGVLACLCLGALGAARTLSLRQIVQLTLFGTGLLLVLGLVCEAVLGNFRPLDASYRFSGLTWPAFTAWNLCLLVLAVLALRVGARQSVHLDALAGCALLMLMLTKTRASLGAMFAAFFVHAWMTWPIRHKCLAAALAGTAVSLSGLVLEISGRDSAGSAFKLANLGRAESAEDVSGRAALWQDLLPSIQAKPLTGYGYDSFWTPRRLAEIGETNWGAPDAHNGFINLTLGIGLVGTGPYVLALFLTMQYSWSSYRATANRDYVFACGAIVLAVVQSLFVSTQLAPTFYSFVTLVIIARLGFIEEPGPDENTRGVAA